ncbi:MAG: Rieske (2Fe-2S) protein [Pseudomonadota bacterium]
MWEPVALADGLGPGGVLRAAVDGQDMVVWRGRTGNLHAWDNRCPHRGMRLSFGFVRGDRLACLYHGWQFGPDARCRYIPAHPDLEPPESITTTAFAIAECTGLVWVRAAPESADRTNEIFGAAALSDEKPVAVRSLPFDVPIAHVRDALDGAAFPIDAGLKAGSGQFSTDLTSERLVVLKGTADGRQRTLIAALQPLGETRTRLHLLTAPAADAALLRLLSRWAERLRWFVENPTSETLSWSPLKTGERPA